MNRPAIEAVAQPCDVLRLSLDAVWADVVICDYTT
jgi:hypothetical protein